MKKLISIMLVIILLITACLVTNVSANGNVVIVDGIKYTEYDTYCVLTKCGQTKTTDIVIPKEVDFNGKKLPVTSIEGQAFENCRSITSITILDSITSLESAAFSGCSSLSSVTIPDRVKSIGGDAFEGCSSLTSVTMPASLTEICRDAFNGAPIKTVYFKGTEEQWNNVWIESGNDALMTAKIIFNYDGSITVGDTNEDGEIDNKDVVILFRYVSNEDAEYDAVYDFDCDGEVNNKDVVALFRTVSEAN